MRPQDLDVRMSHEVTSIEYGQQLAQVQVDYKGPDGASSCLKADYCVVAVPLGVCCTISTVHVYHASLYVGMCVPLHI